jgi:L-ascorbate metabolism protein UlaG (beta-lactamase superfamily)
VQLVRRAVAVKANSFKRARLVQINYIGHATVLIDIGHLRVLTDPVLRDRVAFLQRHGSKPSLELLAERTPDIVLLSHLHYDHTDLPSLRRLANKTTVLAPRGSGTYLRRWSGVQVHEVAEGDRVRVADVEISVVPANHDQRVSIPRPLTASLGYVLQNRQTVYFAGDTDLFPGMVDIGRHFDLSLALLPVWGFSHRVGNGHLTPLTAALALSQLHPRVAVPIHWGSLRLAGPQSVWKSVDYLSSPPRDFAEHAARMAPETEVRILQPGEWTTLN